MCLSNNKIHILIIGIMLFIIVYMLYQVTYEQFTENFDEKIIRATKNNCGIMCTKIFGCSGFATDNNNDICYLSKTPIIGKPTNKPFMNEYDKNTERCNKINTTIDTQTMSEFERKQNATYICTQNEIDNNQTIKIYDNDEKIIHSLEDLLYMTVNNYNFEAIDWGKEITLDNYTELITNPKTSNETLVMTEYDDEYLGQYMLPHKCSANISQKDCINYCIDNNNCVGTEWNPFYLNKSIVNNAEQHKLYRNICCPKIKINKVTPRREDFKFGHFYLKEKIKINNNDSNIIDDNKINNMYSLMDMKSIEDIENKNNNAKNILINFNK